VVDEVRAVGRDAELRRQVLAQTHAQQDARLGELETERRALEKDLTVGQGELRKLTAQLRPGDDNGPLVTRLSELHGRVAAVQDRIQKVREQVQTIRRTRLDDEQASASLAAFEPVWQALEPRERMRVVRLLIERVDYDGARGKVTMAFRPTGIRALAEELAPAENAVAGRIA
jgi:site-specific DNA recombinase